MAKTNISEAMQAAIGGELSRSTSFPITDSDIRRWAIAIYYPDDPPKLFWDAEYAAHSRGCGRCQGAPVPAGKVQHGNRRRFRAIIFRKRRTRAAATSAFSIYRKTRLIQREKYESAISAIGG